MNIQTMLTDRFIKGNPHLIMQMHPIAGYVRRSAEATVNELGYTVKTTTSVKVIPVSFSHFNNYSTQKNTVA